MSGSGLRRTRIVDLVAVTVIVAVVVAVILRTAYGSLPQLTYLVPLPLLLLAAVEAVLGRRVRAVVRHEPHAKPMHAIAIARAVALGKASALVASGCLGAAAALAIRVYSEIGDVRVARNDFVIALVSVVGSILLVAAALVLERAGIDPGAAERRTEDDRTAR